MVLVGRGGASKEATDGTYLEVIEFGLVGAPYRIIYAIVLPHKPQSLVGVVEVEVLPLAGFTVVVSSGAVLALGNTLYYSHNPLVSLCLDPEQRLLASLSHISPVFNGRMLTSSRISLLCRLLVAQRNGRSVQMAPFDAGDLEEGRAQIGVRGDHVDNTALFEARSAGEERDMNVGV